jgi:hypothetical protein
LGNLDLCGRIVLKFILRKWGVREWTRFIYLKKGFSSDSGCHKGADLASEGGLGSMELVVDSTSRFCQTKYVFCVLYKQYCSDSCLVLSLYCLCFVLISMVALVSACIPFPLYLSLAQDKTGVPPG